METVIGISTDKACKPVNVMGMTKAIQERVFIQANMRCSQTRFVCVRYGNVLASRGSVIPLFHEQIRSGGPVTITTEDMTRFLLSLDQAVDTVFAALSEARRGETYIPRVPSARVVDIARSLIGDRPIELVVTGIRPGREGARDPRLGGGVPPHRRSRQVTTPSCRCCWSFATGRTCPRSWLLSTARPGRHVP